MDTFIRAVSSPDGPNTSVFFELHKLGGIGVGTANHIDRLGYYIAGMEFTEKLVDGTLVFEVRCLLK